MITRVSALKCLSLALDFVTSSILLRIALLLPLDLAYALDVAVNHLALI